MSNMSPDLADRSLDLDDRSPVSAVSWPAIFAGATTAIAVSLILLTLGSGLGLAALAPWPRMGLSGTAFTVMTGLWLIITQWISSAVGGYLTGRLRVKWAGVHTHEVFFRDTAHGFITWAAATVAAAGLATSAVASAGSAGVGVAAPVAAAAASQAVTQPGASASQIQSVVADAAPQADAVRKAASAFSIFMALSMLVGAFIACVAAVLGGQQRDEH
jgi:hypothetical protein